MIHRIEVFTRPHLLDPAGQALLGRLNRFTSFEVRDIRILSVYAFESGALRVTPPVSLAELGAELFADPVLSDCRMDGGALKAVPWDWYVEVGFRPGVTDNVGRTARESLEFRLGMPFVEGHQVHTATGYMIRGRLNGGDIKGLARDWLGNNLIQKAVLLARKDLGQPRARRQLFQLPVVTLEKKIEVQRFDLSSVDRILDLSKERLLALSAPEAEAIRDHFGDARTQQERRFQGLGADATDVELEVIAQTWSEHCKHKIFNADIAYTDEHGHTETVRSLFKTYIQATTQRVREELGADDFCLSVFTDNAGVVKFDDNWSLVFKVETHNSPSALDPYGGALTGIVGVNRDATGTGRGAELLFNTDVFCFASPFQEGGLPPGLLHPRRIYEGVRQGVEHGGNKSGIPTVNGSVTFHDRFLGKPLVFCGTGGLLPATIAGRPGHLKWINPGDKIVMVGGRIGKDGIHGATFSSLELNEHAPATAVQIGDPIVQKKMNDFLLVARDRGWINSITDNGAGGLSSSVGEMAQLSGGATLDLGAAPLKYPGLQPWEIFVSEAQERMTLAVAPEHVDALLSLSATMGVESTILGEFTETGRLIATYGGETVCSLKLDFLHNGVPRMHIEAKWTPPRVTTPGLRPPEDLTGTLTTVLGRLNVCSKESIVRQYDHEVQGASVLKPFVGVANDGPADAAVLRPVLGSMQGVAVAHGLAPRYSDLDAYAMAACAVDEAVRNAVAVGADPARIAGLDNFCWCDPLPGLTNPDAAYKAAQLVRAARALQDVSLAFGIPLISGKDSMKNDYVSKGRRISIPPTLLFSVIANVPDVRRVVTMDVKYPGDRVYLLGKIRRELGGSELFAQLGISGGEVPQVHPNEAASLYAAVHRAILRGWLRSAHDCSDGGLAVALAESAFAGERGLDLDMAGLAREEGLAPFELLFSETPSRLVVTVSPLHAAEFEGAMEGLPCRYLGDVTTHDRLTIRGEKDRLWIDANLDELKAVWQATLKDL
jgi:phosphoribosylformylglycinamidine synthase subunit PurSL